MAFEPENDLERMLMRAPNEPAARPEFYRLLLESQLFVLGEVSGDNRMGLASSTKDGHDYHLVFSSLERLRSFLKREEKYIQMKGRDLFAATRGAYFILNPGADYGKELLPEEIASLLEPPVAKAVRVDAGTPMLIGQAKEPPRALMDALAAMFGSHPEVKAAYIAQVAYGEDPEPHPVIGIDTAGSFDALGPDIGRVIEAVRPGGKIDVVPVARAGGGTMSESLVKYPPFYTRDA